MSKHSAIVGGSTAGRLLACPASLARTRALPPSADAPSEYAEEGTAMHEVMATLMTGRCAGELGHGNPSTSQDDALALAQKLATGPTVAYGEIKRLFMHVSAGQLEARLEDEALTLARVSATRDAQEGIAAQVERRKPVFQGR